MLKLTLKPGEYIDIGEDIRVVFSGGSANNIHLLVNAPKELNIARSNAAGVKKEPYYKEKGISPQAQKEIREILKQEKMQRRYEESHQEKPQRKCEESTQGKPRRTYTVSHPERGQRRAAGL